MKVILILMTGVLLLGGCAGSRNMNTIADIPETPVYRLQPGASDVRLIGLSREQAEEKLSEAMNRYYKSVSLLLKIKSYQSNESFSVLGEVKTPGIYPMQNRVNLIRALGIAGGLGQEADLDDVHVLRNSGGLVTRIDIDLDAVLEGEDMSGNIILEPEDVVVIGRTGTASFSQFFMKIQPVMQTALLVVVALAGMK
jgi:protein involved in polysaccharide export with SLBB domain